MSVQTGMPEPRQSTCEEIAGKVKHLIEHNDLDPAEVLRLTRELFRKEIDDEQEKIQARFDKLSKVKSELFST